MALVTGVSGVYRIWPISIGLRKAQAMAPPVVLTMSRYMFIQKGAREKEIVLLSRHVRVIFKFKGKALEKKSHVKHKTNNTCVSLLLLSNCPSECLQHSVLHPFIPKSTVYNLKRLRIFVVSSKLGGRTN